MPADGQEQDENTRPTWGQGLGVRPNRADYQWGIPAELQFVQVFAAASIKGAKDSAPGRRYLRGSVKGIF
jgi:hypothetical protein